MFLITLLLAVAWRFPLNFSISSFEKRARHQRQMDKSTNSCKGICKAENKLYLFILETLNIYLYYKVIFITLCMVIYGTSLESLKFYTVGNSIFTVVMGSHHI